MKLSPFTYRLLVILTRIALFFWHPVFRVKGRENIPEGACIIAGNHSGLADPLWDIYALRPMPLYRIMAKESLFQIPLLRILFDRIGMIPVRRGEQDVNAMKLCLQALKNGEKVFVYPEGTRVKQGRAEAKTGALMLADRAGAPVLPVYTSRRRFPFQPVLVSIGKPFTVQREGRRATAAELRTQTGEMMDRIYEMGGGES